MAQQKIAVVTGAGTGIGRAVALALMKEGFGRRARRTPAGQARRDRRRGRQDQRAEPRRPDRRERSGLGQGAVRQDQGDLRPLRRAVQQCRHRRAGDADRGPALRNLEEGRRHQSHRHVPVHAGSDPADEGAGPARRPHHQQRLDLRAYAAAGRRRLYRDQARRHRADQADRARLPRQGHRLRPDRHRQRRDAADRAHGAGPGRAAAGRAA